MFFFSWIRSQVRNAVLAGINDAASEIAGGESSEEVPADALALLRQRLALPSPEGNGHQEETETNSSRRKRA